MNEGVYDCLSDEGDGMMAEASECDRDRLRKLLDGELSTALEADATRHLETCNACRHELESFAADESWWKGTRAALSEISESQNLRSQISDPEISNYEISDPEISNSSGAWSLDASNETSDATPNIPLDFLAASDNPAMVGRLGEFEILELIGSGGMGIVLKGYDHELNRYVAIKVLHPHCATSAAARRRFAREAQAAAAIVHQHVVAIHAVDGQHHPPYLVMPFVPGESLQQRLTRQGPFEVIDVLRIGQQVAEGLAAAHAQGLVHRDIKPGNILLERNVERVLLTDFGLARAADDASLTQSGVIAGTPQFMSPEQTRGEQVDHRTDLFSLGTVLYTLLAGHSPFRAETAMGVLRRVCDDTPRPLREINPSVPVWVEAFIEKLHAKLPSDRFESAKQVAEQLRACLAHVQQPTLVPLPPDVSALVKRNRPRPTLFSRYIGPATLALIGLLFVVASFWTNQKRADETSPPSSAEQTAWDDQYEKEAAEIQRGLEELESKPIDQF